MYDMRHAKLGSCDGWFVEEGSPVEARMRVIASSSAQSRSFASFAHAEPGV
jgi:hypothetical protein